MTSRKVVLSATAALLVALAVHSQASAQVVIQSSPVVSYYTPPAVSYYTPPTVVAPAPAVSYYTPAPVVNYYAPPVVNYYAPAPAYQQTTVTYPVHVHRGLFGKTVVRSPFYKLKY